MNRNICQNSNYAKKSARIMYMQSNKIRHLEVILTAAPKYVLQDIRICPCNAVDTLVSSHSSDLFGPSTCICTYPHLVLSKATI